MQIDIIYRTFLYDGVEYNTCLKDFGIITETIGSFWGWEFNENWDTFSNRIMKEYYKLAPKQFTFDYTETTSIYNLYSHLIKQLNFNETDLKTEGAIFCSYIPESKCLIEFDNLNIKVIDFVKANIISKMVYFGFIFYSGGGDICRDDGIRYYYNSRERGKHHEPHIHVDFQHEESGTFRIRDGIMLEGDLSKKIQKKVSNYILSNQIYLLDGWNKNTDGMRIDLNVYTNKIQVKI